MLTSSPPTRAPGTDKTGMDFRRILPEIRCQSCLSPGSEPTPRGGFSNLLGWAFGPRKLMKNAGSLRRFPDVRGGFSPLLGWAFGPRKFMKNWHHGKGESGKVGGTVEKSRPCPCLIRSMRALRE